MKGKRGRPKKVPSQVLSEDERLVLKYRTSNMGYRDIGNILGCSHETARQRDLSARGKLGLGAKMFQYRVVYVEKNGIIAKMLVSDEEQIYENINGNACV